MSMTLGEQLALAVLRGDKVASYVLADLLQEERDRGGAQHEAAKALSGEWVGSADDGYAVYHWPEFQAFCRRAGFLWDLRTISMRIYIENGARLRIEHEYAGTDDNVGQYPVDRAIDTTVAHNEGVGTAASLDRGHIDD